MAKAKPATNKTTGAQTTASNTTPPAFIVTGTNNAALFTLKIYRGEGMALLAMNWKDNKQPTRDFVGFAIEYKEPKNDTFFAVQNRLSFLDDKNNVNPNISSSRLSPIQKFRWVHFPFHADIEGFYTYRVTPVFMNPKGLLSYGEFQEVQIQLKAETYPGELNIAFTRGFIASQAFVQHFGDNGGVGTIIPTDVATGFTFKPKAKNEEAALSWMGFEARQAILSVFDQAIADPDAQVRVVAFDFNDQQDIISRLVKLGPRLKIIIDDSKDHKGKTGETSAAALLSKSAGNDNVKRQPLGALQHNKTIAVKSDKLKMAIGGSTNLSWRGLYVQNNNLAVVQGEKAVDLFFAAFDNYFKIDDDSVSGFNGTGSAGWNDLGLPSVDAKIAFSPHTGQNVVLDSIAKDIATTESTLLYSLAFLGITPGVIKNAISKVTAAKGKFVYGMANTSVGGLEIRRPNGNRPVVTPGALSGKVPQPFKKEASGGKGVRLHHKFIVIDFDKPTARTYMGSYNFSNAADVSNGENLMVFRDQRVSVSYMVEAIAMFDHYEFRDNQAKTKGKTTKLFLQTPPTTAKGKTWFDEDWKDQSKINDRLKFS